MPDGDYVVFSETALKAAWESVTVISLGILGRVILLSVCCWALSHDCMASSIASSSVISPFRYCCTRVLMPFLSSIFYITWSCILPFSIPSYWRCCLFLSKIVFQSPLDQVPISRANKVQNIGEVDVVLIYLNFSTHCLLWENLQVMMSEEIVEVVGLSLVCGEYAAYDSKSHVIIMGQLSFPAEYYQSNIATSILSNLCHKPLSGDVIFLLTPLSFASLIICLIFFF